MKKAQTRVELFPFIEKHSRNKTSRMYVSLFSLLRFATKPIVGDIVTLPAKRWSRSMPEKLQQHCYVGLLTRVNADVIQPSPKVTCVMEDLQILGSDTMLARIDAVFALESLTPQEENQWLKQLNSTQMNIVEMTILPLTKDTMVHEGIYNDRNMQRHVVP
jgi:hypothetical protein